MVCQVLAEGVSAPEESTAFDVLITVRIAPIWREYPVAPVGKGSASGFRVGLSMVSQQAVLARCSHLRAGIGSLPVVMNEIGPQ